MIKSMIFKEWLKTRWIILSIIVLTLLVLIKIFLTVAYDIRFYEANNYWYNLIFRNIIFFSWLLYIPALSGLILAIAQYYPEISEKRLKLTLHLPVKEEKILMIMIIYGLISLFIIFVLTILTAGLLCAYFFPAELSKSAMITSYPWFLAGFVTYFSAAGIFIEPRWTQRIAMIIISIAFASFLLYLRAYNLFIYSWPEFTILSLFFITFSLYATNRFRRGVM